MLMTEHYRQRFKLVLSMLVDYSAHRSVAGMFKAKVSLVVSH